jgi:hypothetical protein
MQLWDSMCWPHINPVPSGAVGKDCQRRLLSRPRFVRACSATDYTWKLPHSIHKWEYIVKMDIKRWRWRLNLLGELEGFCVAWTLYCLSLVLNLITVKTFFTFDWSIHHSLRWIALRRHKQLVWPVCFLLYVVFISWHGKKKCFISLRRAVGAVTASQLNSESWTTFQLCASFGPLTAARSWVQEGSNTALLRNQESRRQGGEASVIVTKQNLTSQVRVPGWAVCPTFLCCVGVSREV